MGSAVRKIPPLTNARIDEAIADATEAFWDTFSQAFPECRTGDLDPLVSLRFDRQVRDVVLAWLGANHPHYR